MISLKTSAAQYAAKHLAGFDNTIEAVARFDVVDNKTGLVVGSGETRASAQRGADKRNAAYGAHRYCVKAVYQ